MSQFQTDLDALVAMRADFREAKSLQGKIEAKKKEHDTVRNRTEDALPDKPQMDRSRSLKAKAERGPISDGGWYALLETVFLAAAAVIGCIAHRSFLGVLAAGICWVAGCLGFVGIAVGMVAGVWIGWKAWICASPTWQIVLVVLGILSAVMAILYHLVQKRSAKQIAAFEERISQAEALEKAEHEKAMQAYEKQVETIRAERRLDEQKEHAAIDEQVSALYAELKTVMNRIADNPVLDDSDKSEELVEFVISQLQRKRADSLKEALHLYDAEKEKQEQEASRQRMLQFQYEMDRLNREMQAQREAEDRLNQVMHDMRVQQEQRKQTKILEDIRKSLDD